MSDKEQKPKQPDAKPAVRVLNLDAHAKGSKSLTLNQYKELKSKDAKTLTAAEKRKLAEADRMLSERMRPILEGIDFSGIARMVQQLQIPNGLFDTIQKAMLSFDTIRPSLLIAHTQINALAALQKSIIGQYGPMLQRLGELASVSFATRTMFEDIGTQHLRLIKSLSLNIGTVSAGLRISEYERIALDVRDVQADDTLRTGVIATRQHSAGGLVVVDSARLNMMFSELQSTRQEISELKQLILADRAAEIQKLAPTEIYFQRAESSLRIGKYEVSVVISSKQAQLTRIITSPGNLTRKWDVEELVYEAFGERIDGDEDNWISKIRSYIFQLNQKISAASLNTMPNFLVLEGIEVYINPKYLSNL